MDAFCLRCVNGLLALHCSPLCPLSAPRSDSSDMAERLGRRSLKKKPGQRGEMLRKASANPRLLQGECVREEMNKSKNGMKKYKNNNENKRKNTKKKNKTKTKKEKKTHLFTKTPLIRHFFRHRKNEKKYMWQKMVN